MADNNLFKKAKPDHPLYRGGSLVISVVKKAPEGDAVANSQPTDQQPDEENLDEISGSDSIGEDDTLRRQL